MIQGQGADVNRIRPKLRNPSFFFHSTVAESVEQRGEVVDIVLQRTSDVRLSHGDALLRGIEHHVGGKDVLVVQNRVRKAGERLVGHKAYAVGIVKHGIARDARLLMVCPAEATVDHDELAAPAHRELAVPRAHGYMPVYDMGIFSVEFKFMQYFFAGILLLYPVVVGILYLCPRILIVNKHTLKGLSLIHI